VYYAFGIFVPLRRKKYKNEKERRTEREKEKESEKEIEKDGNR